jgi:hypothetical protein
MIDFTAHHHHIVRQLGCALPELRFDGAHVAAAALRDVTWPRADCSSVKCPPAALPSGENNAEFVNMKSMFARREPGDKATIFVSSPDFE